MPKGPQKYRVNPTAKWESVAGFRFSAILLYPVSVTLASRALFDSPGAVFFGLIFGLATVLPCIGLSNLLRDWLLRRFPLVESSQQMLKKESSDGRFLIHHCLRAVIGDGGVVVKTGLRCIIYRPLIFAVANWIFCVSVFWLLAYSVSPSFALTAEAASADHTLTSLLFSDTKALSPQAAVDAYAPLCLGFLVASSFVFVARQLREWSIWEAFYRSGAFCFIFRIEFIVIVTCGALLGVRGFSYHASRIGLDAFVSAASAGEHIAGADWLFLPLRGFAELPHLYGCSFLAVFPFLTLAVLYTVTLYSHLTRKRG